MALSMIQHGSREYEQMVALRYQVLRKPLGLHFTTEELMAEKHHVLLGCFDDGNMEGCCMLVSEPGNVVRLRQLAVLAGLQGKGIGRVLVAFAENVARDRRFYKISLHARLNTRSFFEKLGYVVQGEPFLELTIPHVVMEKEL